MIYFAQASGTDLVKIGFTGGDPAKRLADLQTGCPHKLVLLASVPGSEQDEGRWHADFAADRTQGEWFRITPRLYLQIARAEFAPAIQAIKAELATALRRIEGMAGAAPVGGAPVASTPATAPGRRLRFDSLREDGFTDERWWEHFLLSLENSRPTLAKHLSAVTLSPEAPSLAQRWPAPVITLMFSLAALRARDATQVRQDEIDAELEAYFGCAVTSRILADTRAERAGF